MKHNDSHQREGEIMTRTGNTKMRALTEALKLLQEVGYNGFSFQHVADALQIKKQSLFVHFKTKEDLGKSLIEYHRQRFAAWAETIDVFSPDAQIGAMFELYYKFFSDSQKLCPLSALATDLNSLPKSMRSGLAKSYAFCLRWVRTVIEKGQSEHIFRKDKSGLELAKLVLAASMGAQFSARMSNDAKQIRFVKQQILDLLVINQKPKVSRSKRK